MPTHSRYQSMAACLTLRLSSFVRAVCWAIFPESLYRRSSRSNRIPSSIAITLKRASRKARSTSKTIPFVHRTDTVHATVNTGKHAQDNLFPTNCRLILVQFRRARRLLAKQHPVGLGLDSLCYSTLICPHRSGCSWASVGASSIMPVCLLAQ